MSESKDDEQSELLGFLKGDIGLRNGGRIQRPGEGNLRYDWAIEEKLGSWSRARLFESVVALDGLSRYLGSLAEYHGERPEKEVRLNALLAATHLSTSLNQVIWESLMSLKRAGKAGLDDKQLRAVESVLKPSKDYRLDVSVADVEFDPSAIEDLRSELQRTVYDQLDTRTVQLLKERVSELQKALAESRARLEPGRRTAEDMPTDLEPIGSFSAFDLNKVISLSKKYKGLQFSIQSGYVVWKFAGRPTVYFRDETAYYSKKSSGGTKDEARLQLEAIAKFLPGAPKQCALCGNEPGTELAYLTNDMVKLVGSKCEKDPRVLRLIASITPTEA